VVCVDIPNLGVLRALEETALGDLHALVVQLKGRDLKAEVFSAAKKRTNVTVAV
jgi:hypothetical protein